VLPDDAPPSLAGAWEVEEPVPSQASTFIPYTHDAGGLPTHDAQGLPLNLAYNGCFDSANGWGEWDYGYYPSSVSNASFWAHGFGRNRDGAWILRKYSRVFQRLEGLEPDTEYGLSFYAYHPYVAGDYARLDVIGRMVDGVPDSNYLYSNVTLAQDDDWEQVSVRARTDAQGTLYVGIEVGISDADWLAIDDLMIWADPDEAIDPVEGDCGSASCDLLSNGPIDVEVSQLHLNLTSEGWPSPNPIIVTMTVDLDDEDFPDPWRGGYLQLSVKNLYDGPTRVFAVPWNGESPLRFQLGR
jgi:hypothetical protein